MRKCALRDLSHSLRLIVKLDRLFHYGGNFMKTPEELSQAFEQWKAKKGEKLLKLYQEKALRERTNKDAQDVVVRINEIEEEIEKRKSALDRRLSSLYARMYRSGASADAKEDRRERTHHLCNLGGLVEKAGLGNLEAQVLLGMLLQQAEFLKSNPGVENRWKERGIAALNMPER